jgi:cobalamin-dependent methionine synthase I
MLIIGERINSTSPRIMQMIINRNDDLIRQEAKNQFNAGAGMIDLNCGTLDKEEEVNALYWLVKTVQEEISLPMCLDSTNPVALDRALSVHRGRALINSITGETMRFNSIISLVKEYNASVVALCMDDAGIPKDFIQAQEVGKRLISNLLAEGIEAKDIYLDPLVRSVSTDPEAAKNVLHIIKSLKEEFPGIHIITGLSNISHGLPSRRFINRAFLTLCIASGMDAAILDPLDQEVLAVVYATEVLTGSDRRGIKYIRACRSGKI